MTKLEQGIQYLKDYNQFELPSRIKGFDAFRALMNVTMPNHLDEDFYSLQDEIIQEEYRHKVIVDIQDLKPIKGNIYLYLGDITCLKVDAIVNAGNSYLLGCFHPLHHCIDNAIHSYAGLQVRRDLMEIMEKQGKEEENGKAKITKGYNLPSSYIIHTVGPQIKKVVTKKDEEDLYHCYLSSLTLAETYHLSSIAFCSISTGLYGYPIEEASKVALQAVNEYFVNHPNTSIQKVVFDVFSKGDYDVYEREISRIIK